MQQPVPVLIGASRLRINCRQLCRTQGIEGCDYSCQYEAHYKCRTRNSRGNTGYNKNSCANYSSQTDSNCIFKAQLSTKNTLGLYCHFKNLINQTTTILQINFRE